MVVEGRLYRAVEGAACDCVNVAMAIYRPDLVSGVSPCDMYLSTGGRDHLSRMMAKAVSLYWLHDHYALPYSCLARHCRRSCRSVMRLVKRMRELVLIDPLYSAVDSLVRERLSGGLE